jgi:VWFA-related protein
MQKPSGIAATTAALFLCGGAVLWAQQTSSDQVPVFRTRVELVTVDVGVVHRDGQPLRGLAASDFTVTVNGQPRRVATAEFVDVAGARAEVAQSSVVPISTNEGAGVGRLFVFIVDQNTIDAGNVRHVAQAASRLLTSLSFVDRSALMLLPTGPSVGFTWAHDRVHEALKRVTGMGALANALDFGSLSEARDIANRSPMALRSAGARECGTALAGGFGADSIGSVGGTPTTQGPATNPPAAAPQGGETGGSGSTPTGGTSRPAGGGGRRSSGGSLGSEFGDSCTRDIQMRAELAWQNAQTTSLSSLTALRHTLSALGRVPGDKTIILVSGGWPLEEREQHSLIAHVAADAAAARATVFSLFIPQIRDSASRRVASSTPVNDYWLHSSPLETLAGMTGGRSFRIDVGAEAAFARVARELSGYYRIGVEKEATDDDGKSRRMKVSVSRSGVSVRAREIFDVRTYEDRDWSARFASALDAPIVATGIGLRVTSYLAGDPDDPANLRVLLAGEASRVEPGEARFRLLVQDSQGKRVISGEQPIGEPAGDGLRFSANLPLPPGSYIVRVAVIDGTGRLGSVDHRVEVRQETLGDLLATGPMLVQVPANPQSQARLTLADVRQDERLAMQVHLEGEARRLADVGVVFEIAGSADGPSLVDTTANLVPGSRSDWVVAQAVADLRVLRPGNYVARAKVKSGGEPLGEMRRAFVVTERAPAAPVDASVASTAIGSHVVTSRRPASSFVTAPRFAVDHALAPQVLDAFLAAVAARPDAGSPMIRDLVDRARSSGIKQLAVSDTLAAEQPVASFLRGLTLLSQNKLEHAANAFRSAMRAASDFYPAMVYLGVCYAAGGNDKEAAGAWRTALIKEGDKRALHLLLADALLRQQQGGLALQTIDAARTRWPADDELKRRFVLAALLAGRYADGLQALDELVENHAEDEPTLAAGLFVLYESFETGNPVQNVEQDRTRMTRLADAYRALGGPSVALIDSWLEVARKR